MIKKLFEKEKTWEVAIVYAMDRPPLLLKPESDYRLENKDTELVIEGKKDKNIFAQHPEDPETMHQITCVAVDCITSIDYIKFNRIETPKAKIIKV